MQYFNKTITLKDGRTVLLRSTNGGDAEAMLHFLKQTSAETEFLLRYPDEWTMTVEQEAAFLETGQDSPSDIKIAAFASGKIVGNISIDSMGTNFKICHRASLGIAVIKDYWNCGLGTVLIREAIRSLQNSPITQIELGVFSNNLSAIHLYEKLGFHHMGVIPHAFHLKDGTYCDEAQMYYTL